jgi:hypothetical protein
MLMTAQRRRTSPVWEFFAAPIVVEVDGKEIKKIPCLLCEAKLADGGGTSNLANHLQAKHIEE